MREKLICKKCNYKKICGSGCMALAYSENGSILKPYDCEVFKHWIDKVIKKKILYEMREG